MTPVVVGEATLTLTGDDRNLLTIINEDQSGTPSVVSGVPPDPAPFGLEPASTPRSQPNRNSCAVEKCIYPPTKLWRGPGAWSGGVHGTRKRRRECHQVSPSDTSGRVWASCAGPGRTGSYQV